MLRVTSSALPWSMRVVDGACWTFAVWTVTSHAVVALGGSLESLLLAFVVSGAATLVAWRFGRRVFPRGTAEPAWPTDPPVSNPRFLAPLQAAVVVMAVVGATWLRHRPVELWWLGLLLLGVAALVLVLREEPPRVAPLRGGSAEFALWTLAAFCVVVVLVSHRIDIDDSFYVNLAVAAADAPADPLLAEDTLHGVAGLPIHLPVYRLHSYEIWNGAVSYLTGIPALAVFHFVSASLAACLLPLAFARLTRWLTPACWPWTVAAVIFVLLAIGETHRWYGNFALVRLWQGKAIFLFVFLPLVYAYAIEFVGRPSFRGWLLLAAAQICAVGCSSTALWIAPASALAGAAVALRPTKQGMLRLGLAALASVYVLGIGLAMRVTLEESAPARAEQPSAAEVTSREQMLELRQQPGVQLAKALEVVTGGDALRVTTLAVVFGAWACWGTGLARRFAVIVPLAVWLIVLNPYATGWLMENLTGPTYWRNLWALPVPLLLALVLVAPLGWVDAVRGSGTEARLGRAAAWIGPALGLLLAVALAIGVPRYTALSPRNNVELHFPSLKVEPVEYDWAKLLTHSVPPGSVVVAPLSITPWLATFHDRVQPLVVRPMYLDRHRSQLGTETANHRLLMTLFVAGKSKRSDAARWFADGLRVFDVRAVCLKRSKATPRARAILQRSGFRPYQHSEAYEIWIRR